MGDDYTMKFPPLRRNGEQKVFWYDPDYPGHIVHNPPEGDEVELICVGHQ